MFSVLVKKPDDHEDLYTCESFHKEPNAILLRGDHLGSGESKGVEILGPGGQTMAWDWNRSATKAEPSQSFASIYVMNSHGRTIASYSL